MQHESSVLDVIFIFSSEVVFKMLYLIFFRHWILLCVLEMEKVHTSTDAIQCN